MSDESKLPKPSRCWNLAECIGRTTSVSVVLTLRIALGCLILLVMIALPILLSEAHRQRSWPLVYGASCAFLSQLSSIGKGLQKVGVQTLPELSLKCPILWQYISSPTWRYGMLLDITGALFGLAALTIVPISVAQPIFCNGLVLLGLYSHFYLREQLGRREWFSISLCFAGTLLLATTLVPRDWRTTDIRWIQAKLGMVLLLALPLLVLLEMASHRVKRGNAERSVIELLSGMQAGVCIGVGNAALATGLQSTSNSWLEHVGSDTNAVRFHLALACVFIVTGALLNACHPLFANRGYQLGRVVLISTYMSLISMATGVFMGVAVLDEAWPTTARMSLLRYIAFLLIFMGVLTLNWQNIKALTSRSRGLVGPGSPAVRPSGHKRHPSDPLSPSVRAAASRKSVG